MSNTSLSQWCEQHGNFTGVAPLYIAITESACELRDILNATFPPPSPVATAPAPLTVPLTVYVLFHETNMSGGDGSEGFVEAVYAKREDAERDRITGLRTLIADNRTVWTDPESPERSDLDGPDDWTDDLVILSFDVVTDAPAGWQRIEAGPEQMPAKPVLAAVQQARESARVAECDVRLAIQACQGKGAEFMVLHGLAVAFTRVYQKLAELAAQLEDAAQ